jgi:polyisoprenoid-binding protein YceI
MVHSVNLFRFSQIVVYLSFLSFQFGLSQTFNLNNETSFMEIHGTSSLHDWHVDAQEQSGYVRLVNEEEVSIKALSFSVIAESLKSGKSGMDKNTYKALNTKEYNTIVFELERVKNAKKIATDKYLVSAIGDMTIAGVTKSVSLDFNLHLKGRAILIDGETTMLMTDYGISPPKALLGTIKTGDEIKIIYKTIFNRE